MSFRGTVGRCVTKKSFLIVSTVRTGKDPDHDRVTSLAASGHPGSRPSMNKVSWDMMARSLLERTKSRLYCSPVLVWTLSC